MEIGRQHKLPEPVFPRHPELLAETHPADSAFGDPLERRRWTPAQVFFQMRGWLFPYIKSRLLPGDFQPIISYLFTDWKCNLECHYCWANENHVPGMNEDTARRAIDWLHSTPCRVIAFMGGEPLLRPGFVHKATYYAAKRGFWTYLATNGRLLRPEVTDRLADAGMANINVAVDVMNERPGLPKALAPIRRQLEYLLKRQYRYGYTVLTNINICRNNLDDVRELTEFSHDHGMATDYHLNEQPLLAQPHFQHLERNETFITPDDWPRVDELLDWLIARNRQGYKMVDSVTRLQDMKGLMRGQVKPWNCRAGQNLVIVRVDGTLAPCFPMYSSRQDWGAVDDMKFDPAQLRQMKQECQPRCYSTLNQNLAFCYDSTRVIKWTLRQALHGFQGVTGSFE
jgi:MoaA/NifB/PqqE/SkfB family radical SAM enzyme